MASGSAAPADVLRAFRIAIGLAESTRGVTIPGQGQTPPPPGDYVCPGDTCDRRAYREPGGPVPLCLVYRRQMRYQP